MLQGRQMVEKNRRLKVMNEILSGMKACIYYAFCCLRLLRSILHVTSSFSILAVRRKLQHQRHFIHQCCDVVVIPGDKVVCLGAFLRAESDSNSQRRAALSEASRAAQRYCQHHVSARSIPRQY